MHATFDLSIIIVNYNTHDLLKACLESIQPDPALHIEIIVVDNASRDGSVAMVAAAFPHVNLIANQENVGFARANNQGIRRAQGEIILLLNSDTTLRRGAIGQLVEVFQSQAAVDVLGPKLLNMDDSIQPSCGAFPTVWSEFLFQTYLFKVVPPPFPYGQRIHRLQHSAYNRQRRVDWVTGAALAARREVFEAVGGLDEGIFMYGEDLDWCWRAQAQGFDVWYAPSVEIVHLKGGSSTSDYARWIRLYTEASLAFFRKHRSRAALMSVRALIIMGNLARYGVWWVVGTSTEAQQRRTGYLQAAKQAWPGSQ